MIVAAGAGHASAQESVAPLAVDQVVIIVSPSGPGSSIDTMARTYAAIAGKYTTQKFVFENRTGRRRLHLQWGRNGPTSTDDRASGL